MPHMNSVTPQDLRTLSSKIELLFNGGEEGYHRMGKLLQITIEDMEEGNNDQNLRMKFPEGENPYTYLSFFLRTFGVVSEILAEVEEEGSVNFKEIAKAKE